MKEQVIFIEPRKTFMEILNVHNQEVPFANILAFYFRPKENHKLGTLFLDALLGTKFKNIGEQSTEKTILKIPTYDLNSVSVIVEQPTELKKRIDILIITDTFIVCIEFKINHDLNNPLTEYKKYVEKEFKQKEKYYFILTPYEKEAIGEAKEYFEKNNEFKQIILSHFIKSIDDKIKINPLKYKINEEYQYYKDFIQTVKNRKIRSERTKFLENIKNKLNIKSEYHTNINGGFLEIKKGKIALKVRFTSMGIQIEKWDKKFEKLIYQPNKNLRIDNLVKVINTYR